MKSPFPGMDPYIESCGLWEDFHGHLIERVYEQIAQAVPDRYFVRSRERSYQVLIESEGKTKKPFAPDVKITSPASGKKPKKKSGGVAVAQPTTENEPLSLRAFIAEEHREKFVEIYEDDPDYPEMRLVTTIEVLSPSNKRPGTEGWNEYHSKRYSALLGDVHLVEIDLLRGGRRPLMRDPWPNSPYVFLVGRSDQDLRCQVWRGYFDRPLPTLTVPLTRPDKDIPLNLQPLIDRVYQLGRYGHAINYSKPLKPPLRGAEATWVKEQLRQWQNAK
ncbi:MAG TPA: DUF4058 family protein [Gemmataceae bacterium]|jgi:hypothetical protein